MKKFGKSYNQRGLGSNPVYQLAGESGANVTTSEASPANPSDGDLWFNEVTGELYVYIDNTGWVQTNGVPCGEAKAGEPNYGVSTEDKIISTNETWEGNLQNNNLGVLNFRNLQINEGSTLTVTNDYAIIFASETITINGSIEMSRSTGTSSLSSTITATPYSSRRSNRSARGRQYLNVNTISASAGGGGGGGSGDGSCDGGTHGDSCLFPDGTSKLNGGSGGYGGANSSGASGGQGENMTAAIQAEFTNYLKEHYAWNKFSNTLQSNLFYQEYLAVEKPGLTSSLDIPILLGGNGGAGGLGDPSTAGNGGLGGGNIILLAPRIRFGTNGIIYARGRGGGRGSSGHFMGGPGGGGGGGIISLVSPDLVIDTAVNCNVSGGTGGYNSNAGWPGSKNRGGNGGGGMVLIIDS